MFNKSTNRKRRTTTRRKPRRANRIPRSVGCPFSQRLRLRYVENVGATVPATGTVSYTYQSSVYDPYYAAGGHQPLFYDQYAALYLKYRVYGYRWNVVAAPHVEAAGLASLSLYGYSTTISTPDTSLSTVGERRDSKYSILTSTQRSAVLSGYVNITKWFGVPRAAIKIDDGFSADVGDNPQRMMYTHFQLFNITGTAAICNLHITIEYDVEFFLPKMVSAS